MIVRPFVPATFRGIAPDMITHVVGDHVTVATYLPTDLMCADLDITLHGYAALLTGLSADECRALRGGNASCIDRLGPSL